MICKRPTKPTSAKTYWQLNLRTGIMNSLSSFSPPTATYGQTIEGTGEISASALETLKTEFPNYIPKKTELVVNPNGVGEEYDIYLYANGLDWKISLKDRGNILEKQRLSP